MTDIYREIAAIRARHRSKRAWARRRKAWGERGKLALVILACIAAMPLAIGMGLAMGGGLSP